MEIFSSLTEHLVQLDGHLPYHRLVSLFSNDATVGRIARNFRAGSQRAMDILSSSNFVKNIPIFVALSYVGIFIGGPIGLALGGLIAFGIVTWQKGSF